MTRPRKHSRARSSHALSSATRQIICETLENRQLLSVSVIGIPNWVEQGPGSTNGGQDFTFSSNNVSGATNALAAHPTNADILYAGTVGGGIWRNTGATSGGNWEPLTDQLPSLSISTIAFSPLDTTVLYAGTSANASGGPVGGPIGILRTTDAGASWSIVAATEFAGTQLLSVIPTAIGSSVADQVVLAGTIGSGLWRSTDGATTFTKISGTLATSDGLDNNANGTIDEAGEQNLPNNGNVHIAPDPGNTNRFYAAIAGTGIFRSDNGGANWVKVNNGLTGVAGSTRIELSVSAAAGNPVYAGFINGANQLGNVFRSADQGANWAAIGVAPNTNGSGAGPQGNLHFAIVADPTHANLVYVSGDTFASGPFFGNVSRGDSNDGSWTQMTVAARSLFTAPHADSRDMVFDANGDILEADDGGVFRLNDPSSGFVSTWGNVNGNLRITELYSAAYDHLNDHIFGGTQDTGVVDGSVGGGPSAWDEVDQGDGGWASVGYTTVLGIDESIRYTMSNNFGSMRRRAFLSGGIPNPFDSGGVSLNGLNATDSGFTGFSVFPFEANRFDGNRIVIGGNGLYESTDKGDNVTTLNAGGKTGVSAIAYGGSLGGVPNQDILYVGVGGSLFLRSTSGGALNQLNNFPGGSPQDIAMDPDNWKRVYVTDGSNVFRSTDAGVSWARVGSASAVAGSINSIDIFGASTSPDDEIVIIAATNGVFRCRNATAGLNARWSEFGGNLANAPAVDVHYDATDDVVVVGTHGRGAWTMPSASASLGLTGVLQIDGDQDFNNEPDVIRLVIDSGNPGMLDVFLNSGVPVQVPLSSIEKINIRSFGGDDSITIDGSNGQISVALGTTIDAGADNDVVDASGGDATILGGTGDDAITGSAGADYISGGAGDDTITAGTGADSVFGDGDSDTIIWNPGDGSDVVEGGGGTDILQVNGSTTSGDTFTVSANGARLNFQRTNLTPFTLDSASIEQLDINAAGGGDSIAINDVTVTGLKSINIDPGAGSDAIIVNGRTTADNLVASSSGGDVSVIGLAYDISILSPTTSDTLTIKGNDGNDNLKAEAGIESSIGIVLDGGNGADYLSADATLLGGAGNDTLIGGAGNDSLDGGANDDTLDGRGGTNSLTGGLGNDTILVSGTDANDTITTTHTAGNFNITGGLSAGNNTISGMERVRIEGAEGDDHININVLSTGGLAYTVLGGNPIGAAGDVLTVISSRAVTYTQGPENDSGSLVAATDVSTTVSFDEIEAISISGGPAIINGTNGFDAITIIARDSSTHPGTDGVRDFTVTVNDNPEFLFIDVATLVINALGGSDEIALSTPAPNNADWDTDVTINGGSPADGDVVIVNTPGDAPETSTFTPTAFDKGNLSIAEATPANASNITLTGVEELIYDGQADGDWLTINGNASNNTIVHEPGAANDEGSLRVDSMLALEYQNMGSSARLQAAGGAGTDTLDYHGTIFNDKFTIDTSFVGGRVGLSSRLGLLTSDIETLTVDAQLGDDTAWLTPSLAASPFSTININGGEQASAKGDKLNLNSSAGDDDVTFSGNTISAGGVTVNTNGVEEVAFDFRGGNDHLTYNGVNGTSENINLIASTVAGSGQLSIPGIALYTFQGLETVNVNGNNGALGDTDTFTVTGTNLPDRFEIHLDAAGTAADPVLKLQTLDGVNTLLTLINYTNVQTLRVNSLDGGDLFNVYTSPANARDLFVDGGIAAGKKKSTDRLNVFYTPYRPRIIQSVATQDHDAGLVDLLYDNGSRFIIQYLNVENVVIAKL